MNGVTGRGVVRWEQWGGDMEETVMLRCVECNLFETTHPEFVESFKREHERSSHRPGGSA